ncbi:MAG: asparagine synthase (glutamine-hydrolyzing) [Gammaproteobacteria bacterium]|jgi:asparagine synthase (glutamine-hydrolysing)
MSALIEHRGPDGEGLFVADNVGLIHRRLSVIDIAGGRQPMRDAVSGRTLVYNGEIYNYRALREKLSSRGQVFHTDSDTEVLLHLANADDLSWLEDVNGMFSFAMWDENRHSLSLFRDRVGIKPLYYAITDDTFIFSSEIKPLLAYPGFDRRANTKRIAEYIAFRTIVGQETLYEGVYELAPASMMVISEDSFAPRVRTYWPTSSNVYAATDLDPNESAEAQFEVLMKQSVRHRLVADVPVGSFNSGGVDSSLNAAIMRNITGSEIHTFSVGFDEPEYDESKYSNLIAQHIGSNHHSLVVTGADYRDSFEKTLWHLEEPVGHAHTVQLMLLSKIAREYVTVALTGEGADEVFGGYPRLQIPALASYFNLLPSALVSVCRSASESLGMRRAVKLFENAHDLNKSITENSRCVPESTLGGIFKTSSEYTERKAIMAGLDDNALSVIGKALLFDQSTYLPPLLNRLDKASMASALECRVPFLDYRLVEWSRTIADKYKIRPGRENKVLVKRVAERWLPKEIIYRRKVGFGTPLAEWLRDDNVLKPFAGTILDEQARSRGYFNEQTVAQLYSQHMSGRVDHQEALWGLLTLELWHRKFIDADATKDVRPNFEAVEAAIRLGPQEFS